MEALLRDVSDTVELLAVAAWSSDVRHWDRRSAGRAFAWARHCERLFSRFHGHAAVREQLEARLRLTNRRLRAAFPRHADVSFPELSRCRHLLLAGLLGNPELPVHVTRLLFDTRGSLGEQQGVEGAGSSLIQVRSACRTLSAAGVTGGTGDAVTLEMLLEMLEEAPSKFAQGNQPGDPTRSSTRSECEHLLELLCSRLPGVLLADVCRHQTSFGEVYFSLLRRWASLMEFSVLEGRWLQPDPGSSVTFEEVSERLTTLLETCPALRRMVEHQLAALKASDGDFDVPGVSVWGDLLTQIRSST